MTNRPENADADHPYGSYDPKTGEYKAFDEKVYQRKLARQKADHDIEQPTDLVNYPGKGELSRFGTDRGAKRRPLTEVTVMDDDNKKQTAHKVKDGLTMMHERGKIDDKMLEAARFFQHQFDLGKYEQYTSINMDGTGGGGDMSFEEVLHRSFRARDYIHYVVTKLLGADTPTSRAVVHILGFRHNLENIANQEGGHKQYWAGQLHAALSVMAVDLERMRQGKRGIAAFNTDGDIIY